MLGILRAFGPATSTMLAERLGQSTGATSYHLRQLAAHGFVSEDEGRGTARERWWKAAHTGTTFDSDLAEVAPEDSEAYIRAIAATYAETVDRWLNEASTLDKSWRDVSTLSDWHLVLTKDEAHELHDAVMALAARFRSYTEADSAPEGAETVVFQAQLLPFVDLS
jgi:DNA-binding MarR family transcriptional regulator